jgi:hypothetical protein
MSELKKEMEDKIRTLENKWLINWARAVDLKTQYKKYDTKSGWSEKYAIQMKNLNMIERELGAEYREFMKIYGGN